MLTHGNISANVLQAEAGRSLCSRGRGCLITAIPLYHIFALTGELPAVPRLGWENVLIINPRDFRAWSRR